MSPHPLIHGAWLAFAKSSTLAATISSSATALGGWLVALIAPPDSLVAGLARAIEQPAVWVAVSTLIAHIVTKHYEGRQQERVSRQQDRLHDARLNQLEAENATLRRSTEANRTSINAVAASVNAPLDPLPPDDDYPELPSP